MRLIIAVCVLLLSAAVSLATDWEGFTDANGYTYQNGWWRKDGLTYYRYQTQTWVPGYWSNCCYNPGYYASNVTYKQYVAPVSYKDAGWRGKLLDLATQRDKAEGDIRKGQFEHAYFLEAVDALGLKGNFRIEGYGTAAPYPTGSLQLGSYGVSGNSVYGTSYNTIASVYGDTNLNTLYQQAARLTENAQTLAGQANTEFSGIVKQSDEGHARIAEILAKKDLAGEIIRSLPTPQSRVETRQFQFGSAADTTARLTERMTNYDAFQRVATKCASCHSNGVRKGGFNVWDYPRMTIEQKGKVLGLLLPNAAPEKAMPRGKDGGRGEPLTQEEFQVFAGS